MRPATSREADGPRNLADAIVVAASAPAGVVVVMAGAVHAARAVRKAHPQRLDAFTSGEHGALGRVAGGRYQPLRETAKAGGAIDLAVLPDGSGRLALGRDRHQRGGRRRPCGRRCWCKAASPASSSPPPATARCTIASSRR